MSYQVRCRAFVALVLVLSVIILLTISRMDVGLILPELPKPMYMLTTPREGSLPSCKCSMKAWTASDVIASIFNLTLPWLNITTCEELLQQHPNMPLELLNGAKNRRCSLLPTIFSIDWRNRHWQRAALDSGSFFLYSAFFDPETDGKASIRLLGVSRSTSPSLAWCQVWFSSDAPPLPVRVTNIDYLDYQNRSSDRQMPYLLRCPLPQDVKDVPLAVSLTSEPCGTPSNLLKVNGGRERKVSAYRSRKLPENPAKLVKGWTAAVCGPALYYYHEDFSTRLVEWLEILRAQGFSQVFLYATDVHPNMKKVLRHYTQEGFVQVTDYIYPPPYLNEPSLRRLWTLVERPKMFAQENIYFTDCVLRHMHQYRFIAHFDPDEVPILPKHDNFTHFLDDLLASIKGKAPPGYTLEWSYFFNNLEPSKEAANLPAYLWALRHTSRESHQLSTSQPGHFKTVYDMNAVRGVFSHGSLLCVSGRCSEHRLMAVPSKTAFLGHFKHTCDEKCKDSTVHDLTLHKYKEQVSARVLKVLNTLHLL